MTSDKENFDHDDSSASVDYGGWSGLREFFAETTMHGVQYTFRGSLILRIIWTLGVLSCLGGFMYFCVKAIIDYRGYPTNTKIDIVSATSLPVPAITICNSNFAQASAINSLENQAFICHTFGSTSANNPQSCPFTAEQREQILAGDTRLPSAVFRQLGQSKERLGPDRLVNQISDPPRFVFVNSSSLTPLVTQSGLCHTFNDNGSHPAIRTIGVAGGVRFIVDIDQNNYEGISLLSAGVEVYLHSPGEPVIRPQNAIYVGPGQRANIALKPVKRSFQAAPYRTPSCTSENLNRDKSQPYSVTQCMLECQEQNITSACGCLPLTVPAGTVITASDGRRVSRHCSVLEFFNCSSTIATQFETDAEASRECRSFCLHPCEMAGDQFIFDFSLSWDLFPNYIIATTMASVLADLGLYNNRYGLDNVSYIRENFAQINIYYNRLSYTAMDEQKALTLSSLIGSIGGNMGLFIGASLLTLVEFAQFVLRFCRAKFRRRMHSEDTEHGRRVAMKCAGSHGGRDDATAL